MNLLEALFEQTRQQAHGGEQSAPNLLAGLPAPVQQGLGIMRPLLQTLPGAGSLASPVGQAVAQQTIPVGQANLLAALQRLKQEAVSAFSDTLPNPLAGVRGGPAEIHYNPLRNIPMLGGAINATVNVPLHGVGLVTEGAGAVTQAAMGEAMLALALMPSVVGDPHNPFTQRSKEIVAQGPMHPRRALELTKAVPHKAISLPAGAAEVVFNPLNFAGPIGRAGEAMQAAGKFPVAGRAIKTLGNVLNATNEAQNLPLAVVPRVRANLLDGMFPNTPKALAQEPRIAAANSGLAERLDQAIALDTANSVDTSLIGSRGNVPRKAQIPGVGVNGRNGLGPTIPAALKAAIPEANPLQAALPEIAATPLTGDNEQRVLGMATLKGDTPTLSEIQRELKVGLPEAVRLQDIAAGKTGVEALEQAIPSAPLTPDGNTGVPALERMWTLITGEADRVGNVYPPNNAKFYADRLGIPESDVPDLLRQLETSGTLGRDHTGALTVKATPRATSASVLDEGIPADAIGLDEERAAQARWENVRDLAPDLAADPGAFSPERESILATLNPKTKKATRYGGDIAAGGGMGITPFPGGLPSALQTRTLLGAGGGGLLGGASAGVTGYAQGDRGDDLLDDVTKGTLLGAGIGGAGGAALPKLEQATTAALAQAGQRLPGILDDTVLDPATLKIAGSRAWQALRASGGDKGVKWHELPGMFNSQWQSQVSATGKNIGQDAATVATLVHEFGLSSPPIASMSKICSGNYATTSTIPIWWRVMAMRGRCYKTSASIT